MYNPALNEGITVVAGLGASGTTYYTNFLNWNEGAQVAQHEHIFPYDKEFDASRQRRPAPGQLYEVSMFALPYVADRLLVRNPQLWVRSVERLMPDFGRMTQKWLGFTPRDTYGLSLAWARWNQLAIDRDDPLIIMIESVPVIDGLHANAHDRKDRVVGIEDFHDEAVELMDRLGYLL